MSMNIYTNSNVDKRTMILSGAQSKFERIRTSISKMYFKEQFLKKDVVQYPNPNGKRGVEQESTNSIFVFLYEVRVVKPKNSFRTLAMKGIGCTYHIDKRPSRLGREFPLPRDTMHHLSLKIAFGDRCRKKSRFPCEL